MHDCGRFVRERQLGVAAMASTAFNQNLPRKVQHMAHSCAEVTIFFNVGMRLSQGVLCRPVPP